MTESEYTTATSAPERDTAEIIEDFLLQFTTIFTDVGIARSNGEFSLGWREIGGEWREVTTRDTPDIYFRYSPNSDSGNYFDRRGRITAAPWLGDKDEYAASYSLWDFDGNGIPSISVYFRPFPEMPSCYYGYYVMYRLIDGEYTAVASRHQFSSEGLTEHWRVGRMGEYYYKDSSGNLVMYTVPNEMDGGGEYNYIIFSGSAANFTKIAEVTGWDGSYTWTNHMNGRSNIPHNDVNPNAAHHIPATDERLTPVQPMFALQERVNLAVRERVSPIPLNTVIQPAQNDSPPDEPEGEVMRTVSNLNLRVFPGIEAGVVTIIPLGSYVEVISEGIVGTADNEDWVAVNYEGMVGFVSIRFLEFP
jgi:hypothetical protein